MFTIMKQNGHISYGIKEFVCDAVEDIQNLPLDCRPGSTAFVISGANGKPQSYMLNHKGEWKEI